MLYYMHIYPRINRKKDRDFLQLSIEDLDDELINKNKLEMDTLEC